MCANAHTDLIITDKVVLLFKDGSRSEGTGGQVSEMDASLICLFWKSLAVKS